MTGDMRPALHVVQIFGKDRDLDMETDLAILIILKDDADEFILQHQIG